MKLKIHGKEMEVPEASEEDIRKLQDLLSMGKEDEVQKLLKKIKAVRVPGEHQK
jgi:hypothetical protein